MKKVLPIILFCSMAIMAVAQTPSINDNFFQKVSYIGAFGTEDWTAGWSNFDPQNTDYPTPTTTLGNGELSYANGFKITKDTTISGVVKMDGWVYVKDGATLTIEKGTIIRGEVAAALVVERGGKIIAEGTATEPIVFTSNKPKGFRNTCDWAGVILCGKATNNKGNDIVIEGGVGALYGPGSGDAKEDDNSGIIKYVRIEFPGYDIDGNGNEINGLTFGSVGNGTKIDYVQVSFSGDDSFEWFGGTVNCSHLIALATEDDDFDTDNGFSGHVQFGLSVRDPKICDTDGARGFESDNDANSSYNKPYTSAVFSNMTLIGPGVDLSATQKHDVAFLLRRNSRLQVYNTATWGYVKGGLVIDGDGTQAAAKKDSLIMRNCILAGYPGKFVSTKGTVNPLTDPKTWLASGNNDTLLTLETLKIIFPVDVKNAKASFLPDSGSILLTKGNSFGKPVSSIRIVADKTKIKKNETLQLSATVTPDEAATKEVTWEISNPNLASIDQNGLLTPSSDGTVTVKATAKDGSGISATLNIEIGELGINNIALKSQIFPNPASNSINIEASQLIKSIKLQNQLGQQVIAIPNVNSLSTILNISNLKSSFYILSIQYQDGSNENIKILKK
jgi:uncharacterized protein YjdB